MSEKNKYDEAIEFLLSRKDFREAIEHAWNNPSSSTAGCLFSFVNPDSGPTYGCGCLTQVRKGIRFACTPKLTKAIRADERIPSDPEDIQPEHLPIFKEWQERIDRELGRK